MKPKLLMIGFAAAFVPLAALAQNAGGGVDGSLTDTSVFYRIIGAPMAPVAAPAAYVPTVPLVFDEKGRSNELIVTLAYSNNQALRQIVPALADSATRQTAETEVVKAVRLYERAADFALQSPMGARHLTEGSRLQDTERAELAADHPRERLEQYLLLRYVSVAKALQAQEQLKSHPALASVANNGRVTVSWAPNDPYFAVKPDHQRYQWGLHEMNFPSAWDVSKGHGYIGVLEPGVPNNLAVDVDPTQTNAMPADAWRNHRPQIAYNNLETQPAPSFIFHATHVLGIIGARANNAIGITGACPTCSTAFMKFPSLASSDVAFTMTKAIERGMQVLNWSGGKPTVKNDYPVCGGINPSSLDVAPICAAINFAHRRKIFLISAAGNGETDLADDDVFRPQFPGEHPAVVAVAAAEKFFPAGTLPYYDQRPENCYQSSWCRWRSLETRYIEDWRNRSNAPGVDGLYAPGRSVVSTVAKGSYLDQGDTLTYIYRCADVSPFDESSAASDPRDGYGSCTGTSMAAPHVSALAGIIRSINPLLPALRKDDQGVEEPRRSVRAILHASGTHTGPESIPRDPKWGHGMPNAAAAVADAVAQTPNRLTPLFSFYSSGRYDYFYTTVPQMATAALQGTITPYPCFAFPCSPSYRSMGGTTIVGYDKFPDSTTQSTKVPRAEVWVFTTSQNPKNPSVPLVPLYRFSWKCGDPTQYPPAVCNTNPQHTDATYEAPFSAASVDDLSLFEGLGYKLDGIEGYIYPRIMAQPAGTVRLMRKYNPTRDDHAIFPETQLSAMLAAGYTANSGFTDWIGYVYPNTNGNVPAIQ